MKKNRIKRLSIFMCIIGILVAVLFQFIDKYSKKDDEEETVYISSYEELTKIFNSRILNDKYILTNDIYFKEEENFLNRTLDSKGVFDGNGYSIYNINNKRKYGLFDKNYGEIRNLNLNDCNTIANKEIFGLIVNENYGIIKNCSVTNSKITVSNNKYVGFITGLNHCIIEKSYVIGTYEIDKNQTFNKTLYFGGLAGANSPIELDAKVINCFSIPNVTFDNDYIKTGAIVANNIKGSETTSKLENCYTMYSSEKLVDCYYEGMYELESFNNDLYLYELNFDINIWVIDNTYPTHKKDYLNVGGIEQ